MQKAVGYLGLAYARSGQYLAAFEAFLRSGQQGLAAEMRPHLSADQILAAEARCRTPEPEPEPEAEPAPDPAPDPEQRPATGDDRDGIPVGEAIPDFSGDIEVIVEPGKEPGEAPNPEPATEQTSPEPEQGGAAAHADDSPSDELDGPGMISAAVEAAVPSQVAVAAAARTAAGHRPPVPLTEFATSRLIRPDDGDHPFEISAAGVLIVRVRGRVFSRTEGVIVSGGELSYEPATRRVRGSKTDKSFGGDRPMFIVNGEGHLVASPLGNTFEAIHLDDDVLYLREDLVFSFEEGLRWENGHVPGSDARINVVQFRGRGCVAIRTRKPSLGVKLASDKVLYVDTDVLAGWVGRVVPRVVAPAAGGDTSALFVECTGEGVVLLEDEAPQELVDGVER